tara:strand:- start:664 stop:1134 length:471 start_codon:yes stop_codon:yes gene_type:complete
MAFSRDDPAEIRCKLNSHNNSLGYMLNVPGNGTHPDFFLDPQIRMQKFGANLSENVVDINSMLLGINKQLNRDHFVPNTRDPNFNPLYSRSNYPIIQNALTDQSRTTNPAWQLRGLETNEWDYPLHNPQSHTEIKFAHNISSRNDGKDQFRANCRM